MLISLSWSKLTLANFFLFYCFWVDSFHYRVLSEQFLLEFSGLHYCLFVKVLFGIIFRADLTEKEGFEPSRRY